MLVFENVFFSYETAAGKSKAHAGNETIRGVSFKLGKGEFAALLGENGAGKSSLARLCNGLLKPSSGRVLTAGFDTRKVKTSALAARAGCLFQNPDRQICCNTVREEILFGLKNILPGDQAEQERRCGEMLERFSLEGSRDPFSMSRGERQRVALASVLAMKPEFLILDEPTTGLDYRECVTIMNVIAELNAEGATVLMITHDMEIACDYAKRALVLSGGELAGDCPMRGAMKNRELLEGASLLPAQIPALAMRLGAEFEEVYTVDEMVRAVKAKRKEKNDGTA